MELRQLKYFIRIAELESITKAADVLLVAQPALSMQIRNLEEELGVALLVRHSRGVQLTEAGQIFLEKAIRITRDVDAAKQLASHEKQAIVRPVKLGINPSIDGDLIAEILKSINHTLPDIAITVLEGSSDQLAEWLDEQALDLALVYFVPDEVQGIVLERLFSDELVFLTPAAAARGSTVTLEEVVAEPLMLQPMPHKLRSAVEDAATAIGHPLRVPFEIRSVSMIIDLVERGLASSILPASAARRAVAEGRIAMSTIIQPTLSLDLSLAYLDFKQQSRSEILLRRLVRQIGLRYPSTR